MFYHFTVMFNPAFHAAILNKPLIDATLVSYSEGPLLHLTAM